MIARLLLSVCAVVAVDALAADPNTNGPAGQAPRWAPPGAPLETVAQTTTSPSKMTADPSSSGKSAPGTQTDSTATSSATVNGPPVASKRSKKALVDDTVNDAQLKQILARGYRPESQARGNEVSYCRVESELGSRFGKKVCKTAALILQDELAGKDEATRVQRPSGNKALTGGF